MNWRESFTQVYVHLYPGGADDADHPMLRLAYPKIVLDRTGKIVVTPHLGGLSGASVWTATRSAQALWTPKNAVKVVAVEASFKHGEYIGAEWWTLVLEALRRWSDEYVA